MLFATLPFFCTENLSAALLAYESFDYVGGSIAGRNGGTGFSAGWANADNDVTVSSAGTSLSYPAGTPLTPQGSHIALTTTDTLAVANRSLSTGMALGTGGLTFYSSALMSISAIGQTSFVQFQDSTNIRWNYGINATGNFSVGVAADSVTQNAATSFAAALDTTYLVVARITTNSAPGGEDQVTLKVFAPGDTVTEPGTWDAAAMGGSGVTLNRVNLRNTNSTGGNILIDELRIGTTFMDVTGVPEPSTLLLAGFGFAGLLRRRRSA